MNNTVGIITRIFKGEIPYINNFLDYYINYLQVEFVYLFSNDETDWNYYINDIFKDKIKIDYCPENYERKNISRNMEVLEYMNNLYRNIITQNYILNVDTDEYLYLDNLSFSEFISQYNDYDNIYIHWVFFSSNNFKDVSPSDVISNTKGIVNSVGKSLTKTDSMLKIYDTTNNTMHKPLLDENSRTINLKNVPYYIIHLISRNLRDTIIQECLWSDDKSKITNFVKNNISNNNFNNYPNRFKINKVFFDYNNYFNDKQIIPVFNNFTFSFYFVKLFEDELIKQLLNVDKDVYETNIMNNMNLDLSINSKYLSDVSLVEVKAKNYYKQTNFNK